jgi:hypothetical protein
MSESYKYVVKNGCFYLVNCESKTKVKLSNFVAKITHKIDYRDRSGLLKVSYTVIGVQETGDELPEIELPFEDFQKTHWPEKYWGPSIQVNTIKVAKAHQHLIKAINAHSKKLTILKRQPHVGFAQAGEVVSHFQYCNGAVMQRGIDWQTTCFLPNDLQQPYKLQDAVLSDQMDVAVQKALNVLFDENYVQDSALLLLLACRAVISYWLPITNWLLIHDSKESVLEYGQILGSFFNLDTRNVIVNWPAVQNADQAYFKATRNVVSVIDCCNEHFKQPENSIGIQSLIDCISGQLYGDIKSSKNAFESVVGRPTYNVLLSILSTDMLYLPKKVKDQVVYLDPYGFSQDSNWRDKLLPLSDEGVFALVMRSFIQYILSNQDDVKVICVDGYNDKAGLLQGELKVTLKVITNWLKKDDLVNHAQVSEYRKSALNAIKVLRKSQDELAPKSLRTILLDGLRYGLKEKIIFFNSRDFSERIPHSIREILRIEKSSPKNCIGWYDHGEKSIYIKDEQNLIISIISEDCKHLFKKGPNKFWKQLAEEDCIILSDEDRNSTRLKMPNYNKRVYKLNFSPEDFYN